jgi:hypothetical protein
MGNLESTLSLAKCQTTAAYSVQTKSVLDMRHFNVNNVKVGSIALAILVRELFFNFNLFDNLLIFYTTE